MARLARVVIPGVPLGPAVFSSPRWTGRPLGWGEWLARGLAEVKAAALRLATRTGRPCGGKAFVKELEARLACPLATPKRGPKPREVQDEEFP